MVLLQPNMRLPSLPEASASGGSISARVSSRKHVPSHHGAVQFYRAPSQQCRAPAAQATATAGPPAPRLSLLDATFQQVAVGPPELPLPQQQHQNSQQQQQHQQQDGARRSSASGGASAPATAAQPQAAAAGSQLQPQQQHRPAVAALPPALQRLTQADAPVSLPSPGSIPPASLDNRDLDKLVSTLGRCKATWRRALMLYEWLQQAGHVMDDRLCTTLIRVCAEHGQAAQALGIYEWMRAPGSAGGAALAPTVFTYTAAMRAALGAGLLLRAMSVWQDAMAARCAPDCRLAITYIETASRLGDVDGALTMYGAMRDAPAGARLAPSVHAYTAAMRAASEGGRWQKALEVWADMRAARVTPTGHAYAAAISACAAGGDWARAVALFEDMCGDGIRPDVVSCTALISALAAGGQWARAESVVGWMLGCGLKPNVRTYTALISALASAQQWERALDVLGRMRLPAWGCVAPNAFTYSALLKSMGESGQWALAERVFAEVEAAVAGVGGGSSAADALSATSVAAAATAAAPLRQQAHALPVGALAPGSGVVAPRAAASPTQAVAGAAAAAAGVAEPGIWTSASQLNGLDLGLHSGSGRSSSGASNSSHVDGVAAHSQFAAPHDAAALLHGGLLAQQLAQQLALQAAAGAAIAAAQQQPASAPAAGRSIGSSSPGSASGRERAQAPLVNEVVCGALMMAYERAGKWQEAVGVLQRARALGIEPNTVMYNTAISAAGKAGQVAAAEALFARVAEPDAVTHETLVAAYGIVGDALRAERAFAALVAAGHTPRDYAYCALIAAHSLAGDAAASLSVMQRMRATRTAPTVHVYNALIAACERGGQYDHGLELLRIMKREGLRPNAVTGALMASIGRKGAASVESQQLTAAAMSAALAAAGTLLMRTGVF